MKQGYTDQTVS